MSALKTNLSLYQKTIDVFYTITRDGKTVSAVQYKCVQSEQEYKVECQIDLNKEKDVFTRIFLRQNNQLRNVRDFEIVRGVQSTALTKREKQVDIKSEVDSAKRLSRKEVKIRGKMVYTSAMEYHCNGKMVYHDREDDGW